MIRDSFFIVRKGENKKPPNSYIWKNNLGIVQGIEQLPST
jgi:hypothetical protein